MASHNCSRTKSDLEPATEAAGVVVTGLSSTAAALKTGPPTLDVVH